MPFYYNYCRKKLAAKYVVTGDVLVLNNDKSVANRNLKSSNLIDCPKLLFDETVSCVCVSLWFCCHARVDKNKKNHKKKIFTKSKFNFNSPYQLKLQLQYSIQYNYTE